LQSTKKKKKKKSDSFSELSSAQLTLPDLVEPEQVDTYENSEIPNKLFFKIGEASKLAGIDAHVLRFWESEFKQLKPVKNRNGQRVYTKKDVAMVLRVKKLLYDEKFTIAGAKKKLSEEFGRQKKKGNGKISLKSDSHTALLRIRSNLKSLLTRLNKH